MPLKVYLDKKEVWLHPNTKWKRKKEVKEGAKVKIDPAFYVASFNLNGKE